MSKSVEFLNYLQHELNVNCILPNDTQHLFNILELIKTSRFDALQSYVENEYTLTPNKNYAYSLRDMISSEIDHNIKFIQEIENNE